MHLSTKVEQLTNPFLRLNAAGLDISDVSVKYFVFDPKETRGSHRIAAFGEFAVPEGLIVNGEIKKEDELVQVLSAWRAQEREIPRSTFFDVSLPEEKSFLRIVQLPNLKEEDVRQALCWEIEANIPFAFEDLSYDYEVIAQKEPQDHLDIMVTAFPKVLIDAYVRVLHRAGLPLVALGLESQAIVRAVVPDLCENSPRIIADIGRTRTSFIVCVGGAILFTTTIELGGQTLESHLARAFQISQEEAHLMKIQVGLNRKERNGEVFDALLPAMAVLGDELGKVVDYYHHYAAHMHGAPEAIESILLVGGDANLPGIETYLAGALHLPVRLADPFTSIIPKNTFVIPPLLKNEALSFATAIGLALWGIRNDS